MTPDSCHTCRPRRRIPRPTPRAAKQRHIDHVHAEKGDAA